ncbi:MAG: carboxypeptidase regulatory-like domain-containing protein [Blastocatellales bacterium]|nr:carboxypeptidase regulatory-like domain-containing protein [Blastocatellales bacterium]
MNLVFVNLLIIMHLISLSGAELKGVVRSDSGQPLEGVQVYSRADNQYASVDNFLTTTDRNGAYVLPVHGRVVFFKAPGFKPVVKVIELDELTLNIMLVSESRSAWQVPACAENNFQSTHPGAKFAGYRLPIPLGTIADMQTHGSERSIIIKNLDGNRLDNLVYYSDFMILGYPKEKLVLDSSNISIRSFASDLHYGIDIKGSFNDGTSWRYIGGSGVEISYQNVGNRSAEFFDDLLDRICFAKN